MKEDKRNFLRTFWTSSSFSRML